MQYSLTNLFKSTSLVLGIVVSITDPASAAAINVDTFTDENTVNGECSLREAIISSNNGAAADCAAGSAGVDEIILPAGTYALTMGDLDITDVTIGNSLVITGAVDTNGAPASIIDAGGNSRIFDIFNPAHKANLDQGDNFDGVVVTLENLKLINGYVEEGNLVDVGNQGNGGAVFSWRFNDLIIDNCAFENNQVVWNGKLAVIDPDGTPDTGDEVDERTLSGHGGGVYSRGNLTVQNSTFSANIAYTAYDINSDGIIEGEDEKNGNGGGLFTAFTSMIKDSTFTNNTASNGGGLNTTGGEPVAAPIDTMTVSGSTFSSNWAVMGGGINNVSPQVTLDIINSTFSANTTTDMGGGINTDGTIYLKHVSVVDNQVSNSDQHGAGINYFGPGGKFFLANTLLSNNKGKSLVINCGCTGGIILACSTLDVTSMGGNISSDFNCGLSYSFGDLQGPDAKILPLADNGGPTWTHALDYDSLAIDAGKDANCVDALPAITVDQRGAARPADGNADTIAACDVGAYERKVANADLILTSLGLSSRSITVGDDLGITVSAGNSGPDTVTSARVDVTIPAELDFISGTVDGGPDCSMTGDIISCALGNLVASASSDITIVTSALGSGSYEIIATISALEVDAETGNNSQQVSFTINPKAVLTQSSGGGFCSYNPGAKLDLVLPAILFIALGYLVWRRNQV